MKKAVVLLSGGLDSSVALYLAKSQGFKLYALSFDYGQQHERELQAARAVAQSARVEEHQVVNMKLDLWGGSSLTDKSIEIKDGDVNRKDIPDTYVPARNMVFLSVAASYAEAIGAQDIFIGVSQVDYSGYVDCREEFIEAMEKAINKGTVMGAEKNQPIRIHAPFVYKTKADEIRLGRQLNVPFELTWSCYRGGEKPCGKCDSCLLRAKAFAEAGVEDKALNQ
ncbi:7-cyano-7-deazaguanine synthase QueC [Thermophagus xiamenensis]|jgi:7-cyano-7-deazaguanine synthase|uniref:7-cyano-7-deazaguanine synthase n=1 Tax=Thermophagus xiamenensis TaxID=385682 RepID=A0A1I2EZR0_9BACT|nr:7-cyano-7-deazaguanine synthase QueC [Thermophagus xiamenensis]SFE98193.1 preQ(0) biosynthesis protein QueC [Thermophagus xiamenensis]